MPQLSYYLATSRTPSEALPQERSMIFLILQSQLPIVASSDGVLSLAYRYNNMTANSKIYNH